MWGWWLYIKLNGMRCHLNGAPRYFDDRQHQPRRQFIIRHHHNDKGGFKEEKRRRQHASVLIDDHDHSPTQHQ